MPARCARRTASQGNDLSLNPTRAGPLRIPGGKSTSRYGPGRRQLKRRVDRRDENVRLRSPCPAQRRSSGARRSARREHRPRARTELQGQIGRGRGLVQLLGARGRREGAQVVLARAGRAFRTSRREFDFAEIRNSLGFACLTRRRFPIVSITVRGPGNFAAQATLPGNFATHGSSGKIMVPVEG
jgi:hypothetical protein